MVRNPREEMYRDLCGYRARQLDRDALMVEEDSVAAPLLWGSPSTLRRQANKVRKEAGLPLRDYRKRKPGQI